MLFNSYIFILLFLPIVVLGYYGINKTGKYTLGMLWLIGMSCWFYGTFSIKYLLLFVCSIVVNQAGVKWMKKISVSSGRKTLFIGMLLLNIGILMYYKYTDFFIENVNQIFRTDYNLLNLGLPIGISFYTFRQLSYIIDCYREEAEPYSLMEYAAYALFFPVMIQGPIVHHSEIIMQFRDESRKKISYVNMSKGVYAFARGAAKKILLADTLSPIAGMIFPRPYLYDTGNILIAMLCYTLQIYFDFSGYCDMAYGIGQMLNIELPINFNSPYQAESISDFWDRWHITLTKFFTKYIYIPLGGSRKGAVRTCLNIMIVFLISGFWHGASWTFILWGGLNGIFMVLERIFKTAIEKIPKILRRGVTFVITAFLWSIFQAPALVHEKMLLNQIKQAQFSGVSADFTDYFNELVEVRIIGRMGFQGAIDAYPSVMLFLFLAVMLIIVFFFKNTKQQVETFCFGDVGKYGWKMAESIFLLTWSILSLSKISEFIYLNF